MCVYRQKRAERISTFVAKFCFFLFKHVVLVVTCIKVLETCNFIEVRGT